MVTVNIAVFIFFVCSNLPKATIFAQASEFAQKKNIDGAAITNNNGNVTNVGDASTSCHLTINQSALKEILKVINHRKKNAIELKVWMESSTNALSKTRILPGVTWANEIGRTLITIIAVANLFKTSGLLSYTRTLTPGVAQVDIVVSKEPEGCSLGSNPPSLVFELLLHQLYHNNEDAMNYQLCKKKSGDNTTYNCCSLYGQMASHAICADYSSILIKYSNDIISMGVLLFMVLALPLIVNHIRNAAKESDSYKISESPMSLSSVLHIIFINGHGPLKCFIRKLLVTATVLVVIFPVDPNDHMTYSPYMYILIPWALLFLFVDEHVDSNEQMCHSEFYAGSYDLFAFYESPTRIIVLPFNLKFLWIVVNRSPFLQKNLKLSLTNSATRVEPPTAKSDPEVTERTRLLEQQVNTTQEQRKRSCLQRSFRRLMDLCKYCLSMAILIILYLIVGLPILCVISAAALLFGRYLYNVKSKKVTGRVRMKIRKGTKTIVTYLERILTLSLLLVWVIGLFRVMFFLTTGLYLNGGFYSPYVVPLTLIVFYSWTNWKSSVEEKYVGLNAKIYKVCKKNTPIQVTGRSSINGTHDGESSDDRIEPVRNDSAKSLTTCISTRRFKIKLDENGEPLIPKQLYDIVREKFLPYDEVLFNYFQGMFLVVIYAYFLYIMIFLTQASGVSENARIISTMTASSLPYIFDVVWKKRSDEQKATDSLVLKSKLKKVLSVRHFNSVTGEIEVEFIGPRATVPLIGPGRTYT